ncbi:MAG: hypothetical protein LBJ17_06955 [Dysgonamonadaceae bacterium]|jgi:hypothetical protein|nr:hypothetical protein [Dysgonamonadaceae bacterium]
MKKKIILYSLLSVATIALATYNVTLSKKTAQVAQLYLANTTSLANAENPTGETYFIKVKLSCTCYEKEVLGGITYWQPSGTQVACQTLISFVSDTTTCKTKDCPRGSSCR